MAGMTPRSRWPFDDADAAGWHRDERGVSPVIGAVLIFGLLLALLAILQTTAVPALNEQLEFQHNERVQDDIVAVESTIDDVARSGKPATVSVETGLRYPPRMMFVNPPPVSGTIRTGERHSIRISNATAPGETGDYWNGSARTFETRTMTYRPAYNEYGSAPVTVVEPWGVYNDFDGTTLALTEQDLVDGRRVSLSTLTGNRSRSDAGRTQLAVRPTSAETRTITVRGTTDPITITIQTGLSERRWRELLAGQTCANTDGDGRCDAGSSPTAHVLNDSVDVSGGVLTFRLEQGVTYALELGATTVGDGGRTMEPRYLTDVAGNATAVPENGRRKLVVEARDRFDNPVSGVTVDGSVDGSGAIRPVNAITGTDGRAAFVYEAPTDVETSQTVPVTLAFDGDDSPSQEVTMTLSVLDIDTGGGNELGTPPSVTITNVAGNTAGSQDRYDVSVDAGDPDGDLDRVEFELRNLDTGVVIDTASAQISGTSATVTERLRAQGGDRADEYRIIVTASDAAGNSGTDETTVSG